MPRTPLDDRPMTNAERQARHRAARAPARPVIHYRRATDRRSRAQRWRDAVGELVTLQAEYAAWLNALPQTLRDGSTGEVLQTIVELDLDELMAIDPPRGYGTQPKARLTGSQPPPKIPMPARPRTRARSSRYPGRHHLGTSRRLRRNPQRMPSGCCGDRRLLY